MTDANYIAAHTKELDERTEQLLRRIGSADKEVENAVEFLKTVEGRRDSVKAELTALLHVNSFLKASISGESDPIRDQEAAAAAGYPVYIFYREEGVFYPIHLRDDADAIDSVRTNPGTIKVEDISGRVVWSIDAAQETA